MDAKTDLNASAVDDSAIGDSGIERQRTHFNSIAVRYEQGRQDANHKRIKALIWKSALASLAPLRGRRIRMLEPMCGYAEGLGIVQEHAELDCDYHGFDYSDVIVEELSRTFSDGQVWQADATTYRPEAELYDLAFLSGGLHHVPGNAATVVRNVAAGLKPGGMFVNFEPTYGNGLFRAIRERIYRKNEIFDEVTERSFSVEELRGFFLDAGLKPVSIAYPGLLAYVLYYNTYAFPWLNRGGERSVNLAFAIDRLFMGNRIGRTFSFATISVWQKA